MTRKRFHKLVRALFTEHYLKGGCAYKNKKDFQEDMRTFMKIKIHSYEDSYKDWYNYLERLYKNS